MEAFIWSLEDAFSGTRLVQKLCCNVDVVCTVKYISQLVRGLIRQRTLPTKYRLPGSRGCRILYGQARLDD